MASAPPSPSAPPPPYAPGERGEQSFNLWYIGILIMIFGTFCQALGANLQQRSVKRESDLYGASNSRRPTHKQPMFVSGVVLLVGAGIVSATALIFSAQSLLAPLILLIFIANPLVAHFVNNEPFRWQTDGALTALIAGSVALILAFAPHHSASYNAEHLAWLFEQPSFMAFIALVVAIIVPAYWVKRRIFLRINRDWSKLDNLYDRTIVHLSYGILGGTFGGLNITLTKATFTLFIDAFDEGASSGFFKGLVTLFTSSWLLYLTSFALLATFFLELKCTTDGLQASSAMIVVSTLSVVEEVVATLGALLYFQDYHYFTPDKAVVFAVGNLVAVLGVITMAVLRLRNGSVEHQPSDIIMASPMDTARMFVLEMDSARTEEHSTTTPNGHRDRSPSRVRRQHSPSKTEVQHGQSAVEGEAFLFRAESNEAQPPFRAESNEGQQPAEEAAVQAGGL
ncbi:hypothetical protein AB1Y20_012406 [Prymnesium parvum]|uniref:Uncharacterized protein n=1 Tax=Prymnesium parvum TaxID=97485 RepID=A0AB34IHS6_PRYPA